MTSPFTYLSHVRAEMKHVVWPSRDEAIKLTLLVVLISAVTGLIIAGLDYVFTSAVSYYVGA